MTEKKIKFVVVDPGEPNAGLRYFSDEVTVSLDSGDPGGEPGEFERFMCDCLATWYDGARVTVKEDEE